MNIISNSECSHSKSSILDLSQRTTNTNYSNIILIDNWTTNSFCNITDSIDNNDIQIVEFKRDFNIEQSLTDQCQNILIKDDLVSDSSIRNKSKLDMYKSSTKINSSATQIIIHELQPSSHLSQLSISDFLWSKYLSIINERSVSDEFFDHYLTSINSGFEIDMKLEYCYDVQHDLYWLTQIQLVSHSLILLHYVGIPEDDTSSDFWAYIYEQRCHPIGWCKENSKLMLPPPIVTKKAIQQTTINNTLILNGNDKQIIINQNENEASPTPPAYLFDKDFGVNPVEQLKCGMLLEIQDKNRPWTLWFVRIINNRGGRLHLRYITDSNEEYSDRFSSDINMFYLDWSIHFIGWTSNNSSTYFYDIPTCLKISSMDKEKLIDICLTESKKQFLPSNLFKDQEEIRKHHFKEGMKLEVFDRKTQNIYVGKIGHVHNEYYFDIIIDNENQDSFVAHATHPYILPVHWATEHRFALMKGKNIRQSEDFWSSYTEKYHVDELACERFFNLITLNSNGNNHVEPGMKMEMIYNLNNNDYVFSVTLIHVVDHLMWLRIDNTSLFNNDDCLFYHILPINSLDVFPVGWAKFNGFNLVTPIEYNVKINTYEQNRYDMFSSVTHVPRIPRLYLNEIYQLTLYVNIRCFSGPHFCSSRLSRIPSQFGPGPYRNVLIDMFHHLLSASSTSTNTIRALRRLEHSSNSNSSTNFKTEYIKAARKSSKLIRPISLPTNPYLINQYIRYVCTQLEACPNLISMKLIDVNCPDKCYVLTNTFALSIHSKHKRTQLRTAQLRQRKQKSLLCHLKPNSIAPTIPKSVNINESTSIDPSKETLSNDSSSVIIPMPGSDRKTRGFRLHIEPRTHTVTRTSKKQKLTSTVSIKQESIDNNSIKMEFSSSSTSTTEIPIKESKRTRFGKNKRSPSPSLTMNILSNSCSSSNRTKKKRHASETINETTSACSNLTISNVEIQQSTISVSPIDTRNPVTWNVNDVCSYLNQSGCSFALKTIKEQEIDGAALLLLDDLPKVQDLLEFKLGPAVKFCHVVEKLRTQVINTFHSSPSLKTSRLSTTNTS